jgi:uncharacterized membrane protein YvlD (DUF360 family)
MPLPVMLAVAVGLFLLVVAAVRMWAGRARGADAGD